MQVLVTIFVLIIAVQEWVEMKKFLQPSVKRWVVVWVVLTVYVKILVGADIRRPPSTFS